MKQSPVLSSPRLLLRPMEEEDAEQVYRWAHSKAVTQYLFYLPNRTIEDTRRLVKKWVRKRRNYEWVLTKGGDVFGEIQVVKDLPGGGFEIGYESREDCWGNGYMSEALRMVLNFLFTEGGYSFGYAVTRKENLRSQNLLKKLGFRETGECLRHIEKTGEDLTLVEFRLDPMSSGNP